MSEWSLAFMISLVFVILKANGVIKWSWWWVFSPLLVLFGIALLLNLLMFM